MLKKDNVSIAGAMIMMALMPTKAKTKTTMMVTKTDGHNTAIHI